MDTKIVYLMLPLTVAANANMAQLKWNVKEQLDVAMALTDGSTDNWMDWDWAGPVEQVKVAID